MGLIGRSTAAGRRSGAGAARSKVSGRGGASGCWALDRTTRRERSGVPGSGSAGATGAVSGSGATAGAGAAATGTGAGSGSGSGAGAGSGSGSTTISLRRPRESARRRTRSADGSSMLDEWLFTPILSSLESSTTTALSTPSSRASS
jgi:hypothetical protein